MTNVSLTQNRPFYDYVHPGGGGSTANLQVTSAYPNYYGSPSPNQKYLGQYRSPETRRIPGYSNYGYHSEMREVNNSYTIPQVCIEDADVRFFSLFFLDLSFRCLFFLALANFKHRNAYPFSTIEFFHNKVRQTEKKIFATDHFETLR